MQMLRVQILGNPVSFPFLFIVVFMLSLSGCVIKEAIQDTSDPNSPPRVLNIDNLTQVEACIVDSPMSTGDFYASVYNEDRTVALMIMQDEGGILAGQMWVNGQWDRLPNVDVAPPFEVKVVLGQNLGGTPCSELEQAELIEQTFKPVALTSVPEEIQGMTEPEFSYGVNAPECDGCEVEFSVRSTDFWFVSDQNQYLSLNTEMVSVVSFIRIDE